MKQTKAQLLEELAEQRNEFNRKIDVAEAEYAITKKAYNSLQASLKKAESTILDKNLKIGELRMELDRLRNKGRVSKFVEALLPRVLIQLATRKVSGVKSYWKYGGNRKTGNGGY